MKIIKVDEHKTIVTKPMLDKLTYISMFAAGVMILHWIISLAL